MVYTDMMNKENSLSIAGKTIKVKDRVSPEVRRAEAFIAKKYEELIKAASANKKPSKKSNKVNIERELILLLLNIANDYLDEKDKIEELKKEMNIKIKALINRVELLL